MLPIWQATQGTADLSADANGDCRIDAQDLEVWKKALEVR